MTKLESQLLSSAYLESLTPEARAAYLAVGGTVDILEASDESKKRPANAPLTKFEILMGCRIAQ